MGALQAAVCKHRLQTDSRKDTSNSGLKTAIETL